MTTQVKITFTGICLFLPDAVPPRLIIGKTPQKHPCQDVQNFAIPAHYPYVTYQQNQHVSGKTALKTGRYDEAVTIAGYVRITGNILETTLTFPGGSRTLPNIVKTIDV